MMRFRVHDQLKGVVASNVTVDFNGAHGCPSLDEVAESGLDLDLLVFASGTEGRRLAVELCWGVVEAKSVPEHIAELRRRSGGSR
jgi:hypothetical protein